MRVLSRLIALPIVLAMIACGPGGSTAGTPTALTSVADSPQKTLVIANRGEPVSMAAKSLVSGGTSLGIPPNFFNATLDKVDTRENRHPNLAEALPQLNTDSWKLFSDGTMETRYTLRPNLTWHDGTPLQAEDFVFAHRVYKTPDLGQATTRPIGQMEEVLAPDPRTVVIRWNRPYADAAALGDGFQSLPRHLLAADFETMDPVAFTAHPFWIHEYVGLGPYKMDRYEPGAFIAGSAFENHALGRPKIDQIRIVFINDSQTTMANVLAGEVHYVTNFSLSVLQGQEIEDRWAQTHEGRVMYSPTQRRLGLIQMRPAAQQPKALADVRVRYAVAHGLDHKSRVDVLDAGKGRIAHSLTSPGVPYYAEIDRAVVKHDFDPARAQQLMIEAGWSRGPDGMFVDSTGDRFTIQVASSSGEKNEQEAAVYVDSLRRTGFDAQQYITPVAQVQDTQARALQSGLSLRGAGWQLQNYVSAQIPTAQNRWRGNNRPGWSNPEFDRLFAQLETTFPMPERVSLIAQLERIVSVDRAIVMNTWESLVNTVAADLQGPEPRMTPDAASPESWAHTWEWKPSPRI